MSDDVTYCVRGCVAPCDCDACILADKPEHPPLPSEADEGVLCAPCSKRLRHWLDEIPDLYATLDVAEPVQQDQPVEHHGKRPKLSGSPALARLDIIALQDPRTAATSNAVVLPGEQPEQWDGSVYIPGEVCTWAALLAEEQDIRSSIGTVTEACGLLTRWFDRLAASPWVDECYDAIGAVYRLLQQAHGISRPRPIGQCVNVQWRGDEAVECKATIYAPKPGSKIKCRSCGLIYNGMTLLALEDTLGVARDQARQAGDGAAG